MTVTDNLSRIIRAHVFRAEIMVDLAIAPEYEGDVLRWMFRCLQDMQAYCLFVRIEAEMKPVNCRVDFPCGFVEAEKITADICFGIGFDGAAITPPSAVQRVVPYYRTLTPNTSPRLHNWASQRGVSNPLSSIDEYPTHWVVSDNIVKLHVAYVAYGFDANYDYFIDSVYSEALTEYVKWRYWQRKQGEGNQLFNQNLINDARRNYQKAKYAARGQLFQDKLNDDMLNEIAAEWASTRLHTNNPYMRREIAEESASTLSFLKMEPFWGVARFGNIPF